MRAINPVNALFFDGVPPPPGEVRRIVANMDKKSVGQSLIDLIEDDRLLQLHFGLFVEIAELLNLSTGFTQKLVSLANDNHLSCLSRQYAVVALTVGQPTDKTYEALASLDPEIVQAASDMPLIDVITAIQMDPTAANDLRDILVSAPPDAREFMLLNHIGRVRREVGTPAVLAYAPSLAENELSALHEHMLEALINEGGQAGMTLLESLRNNAVDSAARRRFQMALLRMGTKNIETDAETTSLDGEAYVSICDGQSAYFIFSRMNVSSKMTTTINCCIRASAEIRDAFVLPNQTEPEFNKMLEDLSTNQGLEIVKIPIGEAATLFSEANNRTIAMKSVLPKTARPVVSLFDRVECTEIPSLQAECEMDVEALEEILRRPSHISWFFDRGDLRGYGISTQSIKKLETWLQAAAAKLEDPSVKTRLHSMLTHMIRWYTWNEDPHAAEILTAAKEDLNRNFSKSAIVRIMLETSLKVENDEWHDPFGDDDTSDNELGNDGLRSFIRRRFFSELKRPAGRHLAELDLTEVAYRNLQLGFLAFPVEMRPREDDVLELSFVVARELVSTLIHRRSISQAAYKLSKRIVSRTSLSMKDADILTKTALSGMMRFVNDMCSDCIEDCLAHPKKGKATPFFSHIHPAFDY